MKKYIRLFIKLLQFKMSKKLMYRIDFWAAFFADSLLFVVQILTFTTIFTQVDHINGWNLYQVIIFIGTFSLVDGVVMATFFFGILQLPDKIRTGTLDLFIVKPANTLFLVAFNEFNPGSLFVALLGILIVIYGVIQLGIIIIIGKVLGYLLLAVLMYLLMFALMVIIRCVAFKVVRINTLMELEGQVVDFAFRIPGVVYQGIAKFILMVVVPYGLIATVPTQFLTEGMTIGTWASTIGICVFFFSLSIWLFKRGLGIYESASS